MAITYSELYACRRLRSPCSSSSISFSSWSSGRDLEFLQLVHRHPGPHLTLALEQEHLLLLQHSYTHIPVIKDAYSLTYSVWNHPNRYSNGLPLSIRTCSHLTGTCYMLDSKSRSASINRARKLILKLNVLPHSGPNAVTCPRRWDHY